MIVLRCTHPGCTTAMSFPDDTLHNGQPIDEWFAAVGSLCAAHRRLRDSNHGEGSLAEPTLGPTRRGDPDTSRQAAERNRPVSGKHRTAVLAALYRAGFAGLHDEAGVEITGISPSSYRTRRSELSDPVRYDPPLVEPTVARRITSTGSESIVHRITEHGIAMFQAFIADGGTR